MNEKIKSIARNALWAALGLTSAILLTASAPELKTALIAVIIESLALGLSGAANYVYTKIDFAMEKPDTSNPGLIFLGVHICVGLTVLGVYLAQF